MAVAMVRARSWAEMPVAMPSRASIETVKAVRLRASFWRAMYSRPQLVGALARQRQADQAAAVLGHEVDGVGRRHLRGNDEVALVLAVLGVDQDDHAAVAQVLDDLVDRRQEALAFRVGDRASSPSFTGGTPSGRAT